MERIRVFVADRHALFREGIRRVLSAYPDLEVWGEGVPSSELLPELEAGGPGVLLVDIDLPSLQGLDVARLVKRRCPGYGIIVLDPYWDDEHLFRAIKAGAAGYASKDIGPRELVELVRQVGQGRYPINDAVLTRPQVAQRVLRQFQDLSVLGREIQEFMSPLSARELEVLRYVASGYSNKQIAAALNLSEQTIKNHITSILRKLDANDRTQAVVMALRQGWIQMPGQEERTSPRKE